MTLGMMTLGIMALSLTIKPAKNIYLSDTLKLTLMSVVMCLLCVSLCCYECHFYCAECHYDESHYDERHQVECRFPKYGYAKCLNVEICYTE